MTKFKQISLALLLIFPFISLGSSCSNRESASLDVETDESLEVLSSSIKSFSLDLVEFSNGFKDMFVKTRALNEVDEETFEVQVKESFNDILPKSIQLLKEAGPTEKEITETFGSLTSEDIVVTAAIIVGAYEKEYPKLRADVGDCVLTAFGIYELGELISGKALAKYATRKALVKALVQLQLEQD